MAMPGDRIEGGEPIPLIHRTGVTTEYVYGKPMV
jgi:hypothetical protein